MGETTSDNGVPPSQGVASNHIVQFYKDENVLIEAVSAFLAEGLRQGIGALALLESHRLEQVKTRLEASGLPVARALLEQRLLLLEARPTLDRFMGRGLPDRERFRETVGGILRGLEQRFSKVYAYGEMVGVLWAEGNAEGMLALEQEWNLLAEQHSLSLLCGYSLRAFDAAADNTVVQHICRAHSLTVPTEDFWMLEGSDQKQREIASLQQKAMALETELMERRAIESQLRREIEQREAAEKKVRAREQELTDFIENAIMALHWVGADGTILWANQAELSLLGYSKEDYIGHKIAEFHVDHGSISDILRRLSRGEALRNYESRLRCKDGSIKTVQISSNVRWEGDRFVHTRCFTQDITEKKRAEEELMKHASALARSNAELARFAHVASHDLKEPIRSVVAFSQLLEMNCKDRLTDDSLECLRFIVEGAKRMRALVDDLLSYSSLDADTSDGRVAVDCSAVLEELKVMLKNTVDEAEARLVVERLPTVRANKTQLSQVFQNLICNAIKFRGDQPPVVRVSAERSENEYVFSVTDNGIGIEPQYHNRIFGLFQKLHNGTTFPGTGLGLALCKKIVESHGGRIWLKSQPGAGSTFFFALPEA